MFEALISGKAINALSTSGDTLAGMSFTTPGAGFAALCREEGGARISKKLQGLRIRLFDGFWQEDKPAARGQFDTFWASANWSFNCTCFSCCLRSLMCAPWEAARLCPNDAFTPSLRGGKVTHRLACHSSDWTTGRGGEKQRENQNVSVLLLWPG